MHRVARDAQHRKCLRTAAAQPGEPARLKGERSLWRLSGRIQTGNEQIVFRRRALGGVCDDGPTDAGLRAAKHVLRHIEVARERATIILVELAGHAAPDELLNIGGITANEARHRRVVFSAGVNQRVECSANRGGVQGMPPSGK
jgi:hypothetical protein